MSGDEAQEHPGRRSSPAEGAAAQWRQQHPEDDIDHPPPEAPPEVEDIVPNRHSASAEAAALRWHEGHPDEEG
jgi:hypothetical protein